MLKQTLNSVSHDNNINKIGYPVYYINLDRSIDRQENMNTQLDKYNIKYKRIAGVDGKKLLTLNEGPEYINLYTDISPSELGCTLSHLKSIKNAYNDGLEYVVVMEDDISLDLMPLWQKTLSEFIKPATDWNIIQLYNSSNKFGEYFTPTNEQCYGTVAYIINRKGMKNILDKTYKNNKFILGLPYHPHYNVLFKDRGGTADIFIYGCAEKSLTFNYPLFHTNGLESTIHTSHDTQHLIRAEEMLKYFFNNLSNTRLYNVDVILYINLEKRQDRNKLILSEFDKLGIPSKSIHRIDAVYTPENGAIGCLLSHIKCLQTAMTYYPNKNILICEDDLVFKTTFSDIQNRLINFFSNFPQWDVILISHNTYKSVPTSVKGVNKLLDAQTSSGYIINSKYIPTLLSVFYKAYTDYKTSGVWKSEYCNDQIWKSLQRKDNFYGFFPALAKQRADYSDIEKKKVSYNV